jgi:hypothetical protein
MVLENAEIMMRISIFKNKIDEFKITEEKKIRKISK